MKIRKLAAATLVFAVMLIAAAPAAVAQAVENVPADALVVIKVRNLQAVSGKVAALAQQLGLAGLHPGFADPLGAVQQQSGIVNGIDKNGDMLMYVPASVIDNPDAEDKPLVALWPVSDYKAFIANFAGATEEGGVTTFKMGTNPNDSYAANWGKYAAVSQVKDLVAKKPATSLTTKGATGKELDTKDFTVFVNIAPARPKMIAKLKEERPKALAKMQEEMAADEKNKKYQPLAEAVFNRVMDLAEQLVNETNAATYGVVLVNEGINTTSMAEFEPNSKLGQRFASLKGANESLLGGLPDGKYMLFGGTKADSKVIGAIIDELVGPVEGELAKLGDDGKAIAEYIDAAKETIAATESGRFGWTAPNGQLGQEAIFQMVNIALGDSAAIAASQKKMFDAQEQIAGLVGKGMVQSKTTVTPKAKTVGGVALDQFKSEVNVEGQGPEAAQAQQMMAMMYGPNGLSGYTGAVDPKTFITVMGLSDEMIEKVVASAKSKADVLGKQAGVAAVRKQLPQNRVGEMYVPVDVMVSTGLTYAQQFGMPVQMQLPADLPPLGFTAATDGPALRVDGHVPAQLIQSLVAAGMQVFMQMQGGAKPGGPGGL